MPNISVLESNAIFTALRLCKESVNLYLTAISFFNRVTWSKLAHCDVVKSVVFVVRDDFWQLESYWKGNKTETYKYCARWTFEFRAACGILAGFFFFLEKKATRAPA